MSPETVHVAHKYIYILGALICLYEYLFNAKYIQMPILLYINALSNEENCPQLCAAN